MTNITVRYEATLPAVSLVGRGGGVGVRGLEGVKGREGVGKGKGGRRRENWTHTLNKSRWWKFVGFEDCSCFCRRP